MPPGWMPGVNHSVAEGIPPEDEDNHQLVLDNAPGAQGAHAACIHPSASERRQLQVPVRACETAVQVAL